jgi:pimeloyl-ACP methyl ester carboxylesterase
MTAAGLVHFVHGKESGPWGGKFLALAAVAQRAGWQTASLDYSHTVDPAARLAMLMDACAPIRTPLILVGSSMGGWVAARAACLLPVRQAFLLAPALYMPGYPELAPAPPVPVEIVHGWQDEVIPAAHAIRYARLHHATLHLLEGDHRLTGCIPQLCQLFGAMLERA